MLKSENSVNWQHQQVSSTYPLHPASAIANKATKQECVRGLARNAVYPSDSTFLREKKKDKSTP